MPPVVPRAENVRPAPVKIQRLRSERTPEPPVKVPTSSPSGTSKPVPVNFDTATPEHPVAPAKKQSVLLRYWAMMGGGSFMLSVLIHAGIIIAAYFIVDTIIEEKKVDFLPGGGSKSASAASNALSTQVSAKRQSTIKRSVPLQRVVSTSVNSTIALPDLPLDSIDLPDMSSMMGGGAMGGGKFGGGASGGFGSGGAGGGFGKGMGTGGLKGITFFGFNTHAQRLAFLVDYSGSMSGPFRATMEAELERSLKALPLGTEVLIIPWAGGAWLFDQRASDIKSQWVKGKNFDDFSIKEGERLKRPDWVPINPANIKRLVKGVQDQEQWPGGTDWSSPFEYVMQANPAPDTIFFLTDGQVFDKKSALDAVDEALKKARTPPKVFSLWIENANYDGETMKTLSRRYKGEFREVGDGEKDKKKK